MAVLDSGRIVKTRADYLISAQELIDLAGALTSEGNDELRMDLVRSTGVIDVDTNSPVRLEGLDAGGDVQEVLAEQFNTGLAATDVGIATYVSRALAGIGEDHLLIQENGPLDVSASTITVDDDGTFSVNSGPLDGALGSVASDHLLIQENGALDVSASTITVADDGSFAISSGPLDGALGSNGSDHLLIQENGALDVSGATVTVGDDGAFDINSGPLDGALQANATDQLRTRVQDRQAGSVTLQDPAGDISGGVSANLRDNDSFSLYLTASGSVDITVKLSPNGGTDLFEPPESPISFSASGDDVVRFTYDTDHIQLTGSNTTSVQAIIREIV